MLAGAAFVLVVVLQSPEGRAQRFEYQAAPAEVCQRQLAATYVTAEHNDETLVSAKCEPVLDGAFVLTVALQAPAGQVLTSATVHPNAASCWAREKTIAAAFTKPQAGYTLRKTKCNPTRSNPA